MQTMTLSNLNANDDTVKIVEWLVTENDYVDSEALILRVESSKVVHDIKSEFSGYIHMHSKVDDVVAVGEKLASFDVNPHTPAVNTDTIKALPRVQLHREETKKTACFSKAAQEYIEENGLDVAKIKQSGLVTRASLEGRRVGRLNQSKVEPVSFEKESEIKVLSDANSGIPTSSITVIFNTLKLRQACQRISWLNRQMLPIILHEFAKCLREHPKLLSFYAKGNIHYYDEVNIGVAVDFGTQLRVLTIREADKLSLKALFERWLDGVTKCHENNLSPQDLTGATVTVSDLSSDNVMYFQPLLNRNQAIILGIGGDAFLPDHPMSLTVVFDHRILTGREVSLFLNTLKKNILALT